MITFNHVKKYYGNTATGLAAVNLEISSGEIVGILGENGSGKTTLLKAVMGLTSLTEGEILIDGRPPAQMYDDLAYITEEGSFFPEMTPLEYGEFLAAFFRRFDMDRYKRLLSFFQLEPHHRIRTFSNGQKAKLEISAGFSKRARYIIMDEPFLGKDMHTRHDFLKLMVTSLKDEETILISTHLLKEIEHFIDRAIILRFGSVKADLSLDALKEEGRQLSDVMMEITGYDQNRYKMLFEGE